MTGAAGSIRHLYEIGDLTLSGARAALRAVLNNEVDAIEKVDGVNVLVTTDLHGNVKFARNKGDLVRRGISASELVSRYAGKPAAATFASIHEIQSYVSSFTFFAKEEIFNVQSSKAAPVWRSVEIVKPTSKNVFKYSYNGFVIHDRLAVLADGTIAKTKKFTPETLAEIRSISSSALDASRQFVHKCSLTDPRIVSSLEQFDELIATYGESTPLREVYVKKLMSETSMHYATASRFVNEMLYGSHHSKKAKSNIDDATLETLSRSDVRSPIVKFGAAVCSTSRSAYGATELDAVTTWAQVSKAVESSRKLSGRSWIVEDVKTLSGTRVPLEGFVFWYSGNLVKMTGAFSCVNQVLGGPQK